MLVLSVVSLKGGVGKTTVTLGLAGAAQQRGLRTLVVDLDPQANSTAVLDPADVTFTVNDVLADARPGVLRDAVVRSQWGPNLWLVPSERALEHRAVPEGQGAIRLRVALLGLDEYDLVLLDTPPSLGELTRNALAASHRALVVTEPSMFALQGAQQALEAVRVVQTYNLRLRTAGIAVNRARPHSSEHRYRLAELALAYGPLLLEPALPDRAVLQQAAGACLPVQALAGPSAREVSDILDSYLDRLLTADTGAGPLKSR